MSVRIEGVRKSFPGASKDKPVTVVLDGISLTAEAGAFVVLLGGSGCGKSTLLRIVAGLETADTGSVFIDGRDVTSLPPAARDVAMVFQSYALYPHMTVRQNLAFALQLHQLAPNEITSRVNDVADALSLSALLDRHPKNLSGGQRQRVAIGRALVKRPKVFLFDEPLSNLDANLRSEVRAELKRLHQQHGVTTLYVTHDQVEAMSLADRVCVLDRGRVAQWSSPKDLYQAPQNRFVAGFVGQPAMGFLSGQTVSGHFVVGDVRVCPAPTGAMSLGLRPAELSFTELTASTAVASAPFTVDFVEEHGGTRLVHGTLLGQTLRVETQREVKVGELLGLVLPSSSHFFDAQGLRVA